MEAILGLVVACLALAIAGLCLLVQKLLTDLRERDNAHRLFTAGLLDRWQAERAAIYDHHRSDTRELLNRLYHPEAMPVQATRPRGPVTETAADQARKDWNSVGRVSPIRPQPVAPVNGGDDLDGTVP